MVTNSKLKNKIAITCGDPNGIGAEIVLKSLSEMPLDFTPILIGPPKVWLSQKTELELNEISEILQAKAEKVNLFWNGENSYEPEFGKLSEQAGKISGKAIELATELALAKKISAIVTAPINKEALNLAGFEFKGHTDFLEFLTLTPKAVMLFCAGNFRVALQTIHVPLREVPNLVTKEEIIETVKVCCESLQKNFGIKNPRIAICGLNPHAGENGLLGTEEQEEILPAISALQKEGILAKGCFPADTVFTKFEKFDLILAMFHDQGLIPIKTAMFGKVVNFTAGLPFVRTSPDHGTAFDIAGKNLANPQSMIEAIKLAVELTN
ncbi:MAG: 4-hydroxythreonine-4-phosphate dehydrogenase PdxA [Calditrichaeota bacterium]|nr:MAG: 4-hydroxythreonine-4-phosphate dehydrogenase PdxA [Calditrichota bacterium]